VVSGLSTMVKVSRF